MPAHAATTSKEGHQRLPQTGAEGRHPTSFFSRSAPSKSYVCHRKCGAGMHPPFLDQPRPLTGTRRANPLLAYPEVAAQKMHWFW
ncbi:hypothetical protein LSM04_004910 [Trypanosoma melophagium]|uniref:uncharacterized protein n=1 Tax=Trypanosoma melophagium TaxID=715481 RepID=UPI00351A0DA2|nr:hypothetical protein LSM04_004910 [Trypanosoma melophagium]